MDYKPKMSGKDSDSGKRFMDIFYEGRYIDLYYIGRSHGQFSPISLDAILESCIEQFKYQYLYRNYVYCSRVLRLCMLLQNYAFVKEFIENIALIEGTLNHEFLLGNDGTNGGFQQPGMTLLEIVICSDMKDEEKYTLVDYIIKLGGRVNMFVVITTVIYSFRLNSNIVNLILSKFDPNERDKDGNTILHNLTDGRRIHNNYFDFHATGMNYALPMFENILSKCDSNAKNNRGLTPLTSAIYSGIGMMIIYYLRHNIGIKEINNISILIAEKGLITLTVTMLNGDIHKMNTHMGYQKFEQLQTDCETIMLKIIISMIWKLLPMPIAEEIVQNIMVT